MTPSCGVCLKAACPHQSSCMRCRDENSPGSWCCVIVAGHLGSVHIAKGREDLQHGRSARLAVLLAHVESYQCITPDNMQTRCSKRTRTRIFAFGPASPMSNALHEAPPMEFREGLCVGTVHFDNLCSSFELKHFFAQSVQLFTQDIALSVSARLGLDGTDHICDASCRFNLHDECLIHPCFNVTKPESPVLIELLRGAVWTCVTLSGQQEQKLTTSRTSTYVPL
eukprot:3065122-Amphidinium_carterae.1